MNPFRKKSDREFVDALRRSTAYRRPAGLALIVLGIAMAAVAFWNEARIRRSALAISASLVEIGSGRSDFRALSATVAYATGLHTGVLVGQSVCVGAVFFVAGLRLRFGGRKDRLLIRYFDAHRKDPPPDDASSD